MSDQNHGPAYQEALKAAYGDLEAICEQLAELKGRKENIEKATGALKALLGLSDTDSARPAAVASRPVFEISTGTPQANRETGDPLQNQIRQALGMAATA